MKKDSLILYCQQYESIKQLSLEDKGRLLDAIFHYHLKGTALPDLPPMVSMAFSFIRTSMDIDMKKYEAKCQRNKDNVNKRWNQTDTTVYDRIGTNTNDTDTGTDTGTDDRKLLNESGSENENTNPTPFSKFLSWMNENTPYCANPNNFDKGKHITEEQFLKLRQRFNSEQIIKKIQNLEKRKDLREKYTDLHCILSSWLKEDYGTNSNVYDY